MSKLTEFGIYLKPGKNMKTYSQGREYFKNKHNIDIVKYKFTLETPKRIKSAVNKNKQSLALCEICGCNLYRFLSSDEVGDGMSQVLGSQIWVEHKRHLVFYDTKGVAHKTCYKLNMCFKRVNYDPSNEYSNELIKPMTAREFLGFDIETEDQKLFFESYEHNYNHFVVPFVLKWVNTYLNKENYISFQKELIELELKHLPYYDTIEEKKKAINKILSMIGITNV